MSLFKVWRVIDGRKPRFAGRLPILDDLFSKVQLSVRGLCIFLRTL